MRKYLIVQVAHACSKSASADVCNALACMHASLDCVYLQVGVQTGVAKESVPREDCFLLMQLAGRQNTAWS